MRKATMPIQEFTAANHVEAALQGLLSVLDAAGKGHEARTTEDSNVFLIEQLSVIAMSISHCVGILKEARGAPFEVYTPEVRH
jgi:hypothetical protein